MNNTDSLQKDLQLLRIALENWGKLDEAVKLYGEYRGIMERGSLFDKHDPEVRCKLREIALGPNSYKLYKRIRQHLDRTHNEPAASG